MESGEAAGQTFETKLHNLAKVAKGVNEVLEETFNATLEEISSMQAELKGEDGGAKLLTKDAESDRSSVASSKRSHGGASTRSGGRRSAVSTPLSAGRSASEGRRGRESKSSISRQKYGGLPVWERLNLEGLRVRQMLAEKEERRSQEEEVHHSMTPEIDGRSRAIALRIGRKNSVVTRLLADGDRQKEHIESLRRKAEEEEIAKVRGPVINKRSQSAERVGPVGERLYGYQEKIKKKIDELKSKAEEDFHKKTPLAPHITRTAKALVRSTENRSAWLEERERKKEVMRRQKQEEEHAELRSPAMSDGTRRLLARKMNFKSPVKAFMTAPSQSSRTASTASFESLTKTNGILRLNGSNHSDNGRSSSEGKAKVRVNRRAQEAAERLYAHAVQLSDRMKQLNSDRGYRTALEERIGHRLYTPQINRRAAAIESNDGSTHEHQSKTPPPRLRRRSDDDDSIADRMYRDAAERKKRREDLVKKYDSDNLRQQPQVNKRSKILADLLEVRTGVPSRDRILMTKTKEEEKRKARAVSPGAAEDAKQCTFRPAISHRSAILAQKKLRTTGLPGYLSSRASAVESRQALLYDWMEKQKQKKEEMRKRIAKEEMRDCTFRPNASRPSSAPRDRSSTPTSTKNAGGSPRPSSTPREQRPKFDGPSFLKRNMEWLRNREQRTIEMRKKSEEKFKAEHTFVPQNSSSSKRGSTSFRSSSGSILSFNSRSKLDRMLPSSVKKDDILDRLMSTTKSAASKKQDKISPWGSGRLKSPSRSNGSTTFRRDSVAALAGVRGDLLDPEMGASLYDRRSATAGSVLSSRAEMSHPSEIEIDGDLSERGTDPGERRAEAAADEVDSKWEASNVDVKEVMAREKGSALLRGLIS